ncbi:MAG: dephospho-CoA kinase [Lachnospiraceae bacterium]|nr:dephospho-CoA kinase [Lachnospiraceae bacterium]
MVIGITGGIGSGKSQVLSLMKQEFGAELLVADDIAHQLTEPGHSCYEHILDEFGSEVLSEDGSINRKKLSEIVFSNPVCLKKLNKIVHPMVKEYIRGEISCVQLEDPAKIIVIEAALLIEDHYDEICDEIWYVYATEEVRRERLKKSRGYSDEKIDDIMKNQLSDEQFRKSCQKIIDNSGTPEETLQELKKALEF